MSYFEFIEDVFLNKDFHDLFKVVCSVKMSCSLVLARLARVHNISESI